MYFIAIIQWASDHRAKNPRALPSLSIGGGVSLFQWLRNFASRTSHWVAEYAKWGIVGAVFAFKLMEWYHSAEAAAAGVRNDKGALPVPPPPEPAKVLRTACVLFF